jgi:TatD DNase family protein
VGRRGGRSRARPLPAAVSPGGGGTDVVDTHAHLESCDLSPAELIEQARAVGVERVVTIGVGRESSERAITLADLHPEVYAAVGVHPHDADGWTDADAIWIRELAAHPKVVAVGECGLDYHYDYADRVAQERAFRGQIAVAREVGLPIVIHTREASQRTLEILDADSHGHPVILHCFSMPDHVEAVIEREFMTSFAGPLTFRKSDELRVAAAALPADRLLVETDSPYLAPVPRRGKPNHPANVAYTLAALASVRDVPVAEMDALTTANAARVFGW